MAKGCVCVCVCPDSVITVTLLHEGQWLIWSCSECSGLVMASDSLEFVFYPSKITFFFLTTSAMRSLSLLLCGFLFLPGRDVIWGHLLCDGQGNIRDRPRGFGHVKNRPNPGYDKMKEGSFKGILRQSFTGVQL